MSEQRRHVRETIAGCVVALLGLSACSIHTKGIVPFKNLRPTAVAANVDGHDAMSVRIMNQTTADGKPLSVYSASTPLGAHKVRPYTEGQELYVLCWEPGVYVSIPTTADLGPTSIGAIDNRWAKIVDQSSQQLVPEQWINLVYLGGPATGQQAAVEACPDVPIYGY
ncbi:MAG TPA: hypothetical protein VLH84_03705 [Patescibacteria group bacterium]|nr:hypothetical protein [Patescibacteria group bacterium]